MDAVSPQMVCDSISASLQWLHLEQVTSYCVALIKLKDGWMDGSGDALPSPSTLADEEPSLLYSLLITERCGALAGDNESELAAA